MSLIRDRNGKPRLTLFLILIVLVLIAGVLALRGPWHWIGTRAHSQAPPPTSEAAANDHPPQDLQTNPESEKPQPDMPGNPTSENQTAPAIRSESGRITFEAHGQRISEESYQLERLPSGEYQLTSQGYFSFKLLLADVKFDYTQEIVVDADLRPVSFSLDFKGPAGLGNRSTKIQIDGEQAVISSGQEQQKIQIPKERFILLGMFSSYALATKLMTGSESVRLTALIAGGFDGSRDQRPDKAPLIFPLEIKKLDSLTIRNIATAEEIEVEQYALKLEYKDGSTQPKGDESESLELLAKDGEFLGLLNTPQDKPSDSFKIYRVDLFPKGFEIVSAEKK